MKARTLSGDFLLVPPDIAAEWAPVLLAAKDTFSPDATEAVERLDLLGAWFVNVSSVSPGVSKLDTTDFDSAEWVTVNEAAQILGTSPQAVTGRLRRGTLRGARQSDRSWRVCAAALNEGA
jgi:hypothetical protein